VSLEFFSRCVGNGVNQRVELAVSFFQGREQAVDVFVLGDITHVAFGTGQGEDEVSRFLLQPRVLVRNGKLHAGGVQSLCNGPGDRALVGDSEDYGSTALQVKGHGCSLEWERISAERVICYGDTEALRKIEKLSLSFLRVGACSELCRDRKSVV